MTDDDLQPAQLPTMEEAAQGVSGLPWGLLVAVHDWQGPGDEGGTYTSWEIAESDPLNVDYPWSSPIMEGNEDGTNVDSLKRMVAALNVLPTLLAERERWLSIEAAAHRICEEFEDDPPQCVKDLWACLTEQYYGERPDAKVV
jgi:hypothetical protein